MPYEYPYTKHEMLLVAHWYKCFFDTDIEHEGLTNPLQIASTGIVYVSASSEIRLQAYEDHVSLAWPSVISDYRNN